MRTHYTARAKRATSTLPGTVLCLAALLAGCGPALREPPPPPDEPPAVPADAARYRVDGEASRLEVRVYRGGTLAALGHNHVLVSRGLKGTVHAGPAAGEAYFDLVLPVASLEVDPPAARAAAGEDFATELDADAVAGTRANMLGPAVLDAERFPRVRVRGATVAGTSPSVEVRAWLTVRDATTPVVVPVTVERRAGRLVADGAFSVRQTTLGLTPFSVMMGALTVRDEIRILFRIAADRDPG